MSDGKMLQVVVLAGGLGTRIKQFGADVPKAMLDISGEPFLGRQFELLKKNGVEKVLLCIGHLAEKIESYAEDGSRFGLKVEYSYDGPKLRGTAGAIHNALPLLDENFFVLYGDSYLPIDFKPVQNHFLSSSRNALMTVLRNEGRWDKSNVEFAEGEIAVYDKRLNSPAMKHIDYGLGVFKRAVFEALPKFETLDLALVYQEQLKLKQLAAFEVSQRFYEIGSPEGLLELRALLASR